MLIIEIAVGVFLGGMGLWAFVSYREKKKQVRHAEEQLDLLFKAADRYITQRFNSLLAGYLDIFRGRLATIFDDPKCSPKDAALAEFYILNEKAEELKTRVTTETREALKDSLLTADKIGAREEIDQYIDRLIRPLISSIKNESMLLLTRELLSFNDDTLPSVTQGHPRKQCILGNAHRVGENVEQNYQEAARLLRLSAEQGYLDAQGILGQMYYEGEGIDQNYQEALKWFHLAAAQGDAFAENMLGLMYGNGYEVTQDYQEALRWYQLSAAQGFAAAQINLGAMYCNGEGVAQDYVRARMWFILAAAKGDTTGQNNLEVTDRSMTPAQIAEAEELALDHDKTVLEWLLRQSERLLTDPL